MQEYLPIAALKYQYAFDKERHMSKTEKSGTLLVTKGKQLKTQILGPQQLSVLSSFPGVGGKRRRHDR